MRELTCSSVPFRQKSLAPPFLAEVENSFLSSFLCAKGSFSLALPEATLSLKIHLTPQPSILLFAHGSFSFCFDPLIAIILLGFSRISLKSETILWQVLGPECGHSCLAQIKGRISYCPSLKADKEKEGQKGSSFH